MKKSLTIPLTSWEVRGGCGGDDSEAEEKQAALLAGYDSSSPLSRAERRRQEDVLAGARSRRSLQILNSDFSDRQQLISSLTRRIRKYLDS